MWPTDNPFLLGAWTPVSEEIVIDDLEIEGTLPDDLVGTLYRNSANQRFVPLNPDRYHMFDGDGMLYSLSLRDGKASYRNKWVATDGAKVEVAAGRALYNGLYGSSGVAQLELPVGAPVIKHVGSVNVIAYADKVLALQESGDKWWDVDPVSLEVQGTFDFCGQTTGRGALTAHPHTDPKTGNLLFMELDSPNLTLDLCEAGPDGTLINRHTIALDYSPYLHDLIFTEDFFIVMMGPIGADLDFTKYAPRGRSPFSFDPERGSRVVIVHRRTGAARWFSDESNQVNHFMNAYQDGSTLVIDAAISQVFGGDKDVIVEDIFPFPRYGKPGPVGPPVMWRWHVDLETGNVKGEHVGGLMGDLCRPNESLMGSSFRYGYLAAAFHQQGGGGGFNSAVKYDYETGLAVTQQGSATKPYNVGEPLFVPRTGATAEDDGYVLAMFRDPETNTSELLVIAAQDFDGEPLARVKIDAWVPNSVHGNWVPAK